MWRHAKDKNAVLGVELGNVPAEASFDQSDAPVNEGVQSLLDEVAGGGCAFLVEATGDCHVTLSR
jgi:hypothetical protein